MKVLVTGKGGQLAWELQQAKPEGVELFSLGIDELDITDQSAVELAFATIKPDVVINAAAYTAVDLAESHQDIAYAVNQQGPRFIAQSCKKTNAYLLHVSTDFVFSGDKSTPYSVDAVAKPLNVYGASKLAGDLAVAEVLADQALIVRTAWVYSVHGNNFVKGMLKLMESKSELGIIYDQVCTPTWAKGLALWLWTMVAKLNKDENTAGAYQLAGTAKGQVSTFHWTDAGLASWYDFAIAIQELGLEKGLLSQAIPIKAIPASAYPLPAVRPSFTVLNKITAEQASGIETIHWRKQLSLMMDQLV
ncbi:dTDP-4-dehydrorhamnose reductase [Agarivorans sp. QJM3NY_25]|uniref:dTDP-4-dehydrorhamnose reductase n=1 Tax=Agarivorans sp. QJM3NY_25 TaxID=3421430 RepID=UPI003D7D2CF4